MSDLLNVTVDKYTVIQTSDGKSFVLRNGEPWPAYEGKPLGSLPLALAYEVDRLRSLPNVQGWNTDISQAPHGKKVLLATKCGKVTTSSFIVDEGRWHMLAAGEQPVAWQPWPTHPGGA